MPFQPSLLEIPNYRAPFVLHLHNEPVPHFDLRILVGKEVIDFVLPDGPSSDPRVQVVAKRMHDHKKSILNFEGIMRRNEHEAGRLIIADLGGIVPEKSHLDTPDNLIRGGIDAGYLRFTIYGKRMRGDYTLQREEKDWLLRKVHDSGSFYYLLSDLSTSVLTGRTIDQLGSKQPVRTQPPTTPTSERRLGPLQLSS